MSGKNCIRLAGITAILGVAGFAAPAQAFSLGTSGLQFDQTTTVNFSLVNTQGAYTSALKIVEDLGDGQFRDLGTTLFAETRSSDNGGQNDWLGTCGAGRTIAVQEMIKISMISNSPCRHSPTPVLMYQNQQL
jgi:hypothetical protein